MEGTAATFAHGISLARRIWESGFDCCPPSGTSKFAWTGRCTIFSTPWLASAAIRTANTTTVPDGSSCGAAGRISKPCWMVRQPSASQSCD